MSNPFSGIITDKLKEIHKNMIDALLEDGALTRKCTLVYEATKFTECPNCIFDPIGGKSSNKYKNGGPYTFSQGQCPYCNGAGKISNSSSSTIYLMCIFDSKKFIYSNPNLKTGDIRMQTMSKITTYSSLEKCTYLQLAEAAIAGNTNLRFIRASDPEPLGWGDDNWIITSWKRA